MKKITPIIIVSAIIANACSDGAIIPEGDIRDNFDAYCKMTKGNPDINYNKEQTSYKEMICRCGSYNCKGKACKSKGTKCDDKVCIDGDMIYKEINNVCTQFTCKDGNFNSDGEKCENGKQCKKNIEGVNIGCGECNTGEVVCDNIDNGYEIGCYLGQFDMEHKIECADRCTDAKGIQQCNNYKEGSIVCKDGILTEYKNNNTQSKNCKEIKQLKSDVPDSIVQCINSTTCGECIESKTECQYDSSTGLNIQTKCINGKRNQIKICDECEGNECLSCKNGDKKCRDKILFNCQNGEWVEGDQCANGCDQNTNECKTESENEACSNDAARCNSNSIEICKKNHWFVEKTCAEEETCDSDSRACKCTKDATRCNSNHEPEICIDGTWKECESNESCNNLECNKQDNNLCLAKKDGVYCNNTRYFICKDNTVEASNDLQSNQMCSNEYNGDVYSCKGIANSHEAVRCPNGCDYNGCIDNPCENGDTECKDGKFSYCYRNSWQTNICNETANNKYHICKDDTDCIHYCIDEDESGYEHSYGWSGPDYGFEDHFDACPGHFSCKVDDHELSVCGDCKNNTTQCSEDKKAIKKCENGQWKEDKQCPNGCDPEQKKCKDKDEEGTCFKFDTAPKDTIKSIWIKYNDTGKIDISNASACTDNDCQHCDTTCQIDNSNTVVYSSNFSAVYSCEKGQPINITCFDSDPTTCHIVQGKCDQMCNVNKDFNECKIKISNEKYYKCHCINGSYEISKCESNCTSVSNEC